MKKTIAMCVCSVGLLMGNSASAQTGEKDPEVEKVLERFDFEPTIRETQVAAIRYYNVNPENITSLRKRARTKALVPGVSLGFSNSLTSFNRDVNDIIFRQLGSKIIEQQTSDFIGFTASASWTFDRLIFNAEELDVLSLIGIQDGLQREVTALYYVRRRLQIEVLLNPAESLEGRLSTRLRMEELTGLLNAYTGGFFSKAIEERRSKKKKSRRKSSKATNLDIKADKKKRLASKTKKKSENSDSIKMR